MLRGSASSHNLAGHSEFEFREEAADIFFCNDSSYNNMPTVDGTRELCRKKKRERGREKERERERESKQLT